MSAGRAVAFLTAAEVADRLRCKPRTVYGLCRTGDLAASRVAGHWLIDPADLDAYVRRNRNQADEPVTPRRKRRARAA